MDEKTGFFTRAFRKAGVSLRTGEGVSDTDAPDTAAQGDPAADTCAEDTGASDGCPSDMHDADACPADACPADMPDSGSLAPYDRGAGSGPSSGADPGDGQWQDRLCSHDRKALKGRWGVGPAGKSPGEEKHGHAGRGILSLGLLVLLALHPTAARSADSIRIRLKSGRSVVLEAGEDISRAAIADPEVADVAVLSPRELLLNGKRPGSTTLLTWQNGGRGPVFDVVVEMDTSQLAELIRDLQPGVPVEVHAANGAVVLSGSAGRQEIIDELVELSRAYSETVINLMEVSDPAQISLKVRFAEVDRGKARDLGLDIITQGATFTAASFTGGVGAPQLPSTPQYGRISPKDLVLPQGTNLMVGIRKSTDMAFLLRAHEQRDVLRIVAEPNLIARNGEEASFLAGGEFPVPIVQGGGDAGSSVTVEFKAVGIRLKFKPEITDAGTISMHVAPEVSTLDFGPAAVRVGGFDIPALVVRRTETTVELREGESLVIGGLMSQNFTKVQSRIPILGDLPILGLLFRSERFVRNETELIVLVTPELVKPVELAELVKQVRDRELRELLMPPSPPAGSPEAVRRLLADSSRDDDEPVAKVYRWGRDQYRKGNYADAAGAFEAVLERDPEHRLARRYRELTS